jgi:hypothetical protein
MITLTADEVTLAILRQASGLAEIRDPSGATVGFFAPVSMERAHLYAQAAAQARTEIERRKREEQAGRTTREVFEHLQSLTDDPDLRAYMQKKIDDLRQRDGCATP